MSPATRAHFEVGGVRLSAVIEGEGPPLLVLHGFTGDAESMSSVAASFADRFQVIRLELVGHGESDSPTDAAAYTMPACVQQIRGVVEALALSRAPSLLGYSMGGRAALSSAVEAPDLFRRLVLVGATAGIADPKLRAERVVADEALADRIENEGLARFVDRWMALPLFASQARLGEAALEAARAQRMRCDPAGLAQSLRGMGAGAQPPLFDALERFERPALLVVGAEDEKFQGIARQLVSGLPDARVASLPEAGHAAHLEAPEAFARVVGEFLAEGNEHD
ncbi:MAG: 2-succinyl-6-hydroxy-2,4-cyclohexadiene-1-carboxylate synthase [Myxococcota bacterium]